MKRSLALGQSSVCVVKNKRGRKAIPYVTVTACPGSGTSAMFVLLSMYNDLETGIGIATGVLDGVVLGWLRRWNVVLGARTSQLGLLSLVHGFDGVWHSHTSRVLLNNLTSEHRFRQECGT